MELVQHEPHRARTRRPAPARAVSRAARKLTLLVISGAMALVGVLLWLILHAPIGDRWKANCACALAGFWGMATLGYRRAMIPVTRSAVRRAG